MKKIGIVWGTLCVGAFYLCNLRSLVYPRYELLRAIPVAIGALGVLGCFWKASKSARAAEGSVFVFLLACGFLWFNMPVYRPVMEKIKADEDLAVKVPMLSGEDENRYCARLAAVLGDSDRFLRLGAARRLRTCGAAGRPALPQLVLASDESDILIRTAAKDARESIEAKTER